MIHWDGQRQLPDLKTVILVGVVEQSDFHSFAVKSIEQPGAYAHSPKILAKRCPVRETPARPAMMNADHSIAPDVSITRACDRHLIWRIICDQPSGLAAKGAIAAPHPGRLKWNLNPDISAVTASRNGHRDISRGKSVDA